MTNSPQKSTALHLKAPGFDIVMTPVELDRNIMPAVKLAVSCTILHPSGNFTYSAGDVWIDFEALDGFISELGSLPNRQDGFAALICMDQAFKIELSRQDKGFKTRISITEGGSGEAETHLTGTFLFKEMDLINNWYRNFSHFRR